MPNAEEYGHQLVAMLEEEARQFGTSLQGSGEVLAAYAASRIDHLKAILEANEPGFPEAVRVEGHNVALQAAMEAVDRADELDARINGIAIGALSIASQALGGLAPPA